MKTSLVTLLAAVLCVEQAAVLSGSVLIVWCWMPGYNHAVIYGIVPNDASFYPIICYVCQEQESNKNCLTISMCAKEDKYCVTVRNNVGTKPNKPNYVISKMCSPRCPATSQQQNQTYQTVSCCEKPLCNVNGVSSKESSYGVMSLGVLASITYIFACGL